MSRQKFVIVVILYGIKIFVSEVFNSSFFEGNSKFPLKISRTKYEVIN